MKLFARPAMTNDERTRCLLYRNEQLRVVAFLDRERSLLDSVLGRGRRVVMDSPAAADEACRASDRFRQAAEEAVRRHMAIRSVPSAASRFHEIQTSYFSFINAWAKTNLSVMETLAAGQPPFYVRFEKLQDQAQAARRQANAAYRSFRRRLGLPADALDALEAALHTHDFKDAQNDGWQPKPYTHDISEAQNRINATHNWAQATADTMIHNPIIGEPPCPNETLDRRDEAPPVDRQDAAEWFNKGVCLAAAGRRQDAIACYDQVLSRDPRDAAAWFNKGVSLAVLTRREEAVECFDRAIEIDAQDEMAWCAKGVNLDALGRPQEAIACWDRALQIDPQCAAAWCAKGVSLAGAGRHEEAVACFDAALKIDPCIAPVWSNKGSCLGVLNRHDDAVLCCDKALEIDPQDGAAWYNRGVSLAALARHEEAIACFSAALAIDPLIAAAWGKKGNSLTLLRRPEEAIVCYARAVRIDPKDAAAWYNKALREEACGRPADALQSYRQFIEVAPPQREELVAAAKARIAELNSSATVASQPASRDT